MTNKVSKGTADAAAAPRPDYSITDTEVAIMKTMMQAAPGSWSVSDFACECCGNTVVTVGPTSDAVVGPQFELSRNSDHRIDLKTTWLDGKEYSSEFWLLHAALHNVLSTITCNLPHRQLVNPRR